MATTANVCNVCQANFATSTGLKIHATRKHKDEIAKEEETKETIDEPIENQTEEETIDGNINKGDISKVDSVSTQTNTDEEQQTIKYTVKIRLPPCFELDLHSFSEDKVKRVKDYAHAKADYFIMLENLKEGESIEFKHDPLFLSSDELFHGKLVKEEIEFWKDDGLPYYKITYENAFAVPDSHENYHAIEFVYRCGDQCKCIFLIPHMLLDILKIVVEKDPNVAKWLCKAKYFVYYFPTNINVVSPTNMPMNTIYEECDE